MKTLPILFSEVMIKAILQNNKTMTRRIIKPQPPCIDNHTKEWGPPNDVSWHKEPFFPVFAGGELHCGNCGFYIKYDGHGLKPRYQIGDILWVRETWNNFAGYYHYKADCGSRGEEYRQEYLKSGNKSANWKPSIFMPYSACRIWLKVTDVRVERLQDISEGDAIKEGISIVDNIPNLYENYLHGKNAIWQMDGEKWDIKKTYGFVSPINSYRSLWQKINGKDSWDLNPFVWVYSFIKIEKP